MAAEIRDLIAPGQVSPAQGAVEELRRLGRNLGGYHGETIDISQILAGCSDAASARQWELERLEAGGGLELLAFHRQGGTVGSPKVYISSGIHGDEPAGPLATRDLVCEGLDEPFEFWMCPCLNPTGFPSNARENAQGWDLNRQYLEPEAREIIAHVGWLERQPRFDLCLCLHEDWEASGFYLYELNPDGMPSMAERIISEVAKVCPIDHAEVIDGRPSSGGIIRPGFEPNLRPQWPEAFFLLMHKTRLSYTLEAPSDFPLSLRVQALKTAVRTALACLGERQKTA